MSLLSRKLFPHNNVFVLPRDPALKELNINQCKVRAQLALAPLHKELLKAFVETLTQCSDNKDMEAVQAIYENAMASHNGVIVIEATAALQLYFTPEAKFASSK